MNKLVSKNPIQRFKQGRKIVKAKSGVPMFYGIAPQKNWKGKKGELNLTDEEKAILAQHGIKYDNAYDLQSEINSLLNYQYLYGIGKNNNENYQEYIAQDNKWGDQSQAGLNWLIEKLKRTPKPILDGNGAYIYDSPTLTAEINYDYNQDWNEWEKNRGKEKILRESDKFREPYGKSYIEHLSPNPQQWMKGEGEYVNILPYQNPQPELKGEIPGLKIKPVRFNQYNRSDIRNLIRQKKYNPYDFSAVQRRALRKYLNGESDDVSQLEGTPLYQFTIPYTQQQTQEQSQQQTTQQTQQEKKLHPAEYKRGGLISRNPIIRFKKRNK